MFQKKLLLRVLCLGLFLGLLTLLCGQNCNISLPPSAVIDSPLEGESFATSEMVKFSATLKNVDPNADPPINVEIHLDDTKVISNGWLNVADNTFWISDYYKDATLGIISFTICKLTPGEHQIQVAFPDNAATDPTIRSFIAHPYGTGKDSELNISADLNWKDVAGAALGKVVVIGVDALTLADATGFKAGDEVLLINSQGASGAYENTGNWEFLTIKSVEGKIVTFTSEILKLYGVGESNNDLTGQKIQLVRVPHFSQVTIGAKLTIVPWNGEIGGILAFRASEKISFSNEGTGLIYASESGFRGYVLPDDNGAYYGEGIAGLGKTVDSVSGGMGGNGGAFGSAGGAHYAVKSACDDASTPTEQTPVFGDESLSKLVFGGAGGSTVDNDFNYDQKGGGKSGAIVFLAGKIIENANISNNGGLGGSANNVCWCDTAAGGGSGGAIYLLADTLSMNSVSALGGSGGKGGCRAAYNGGNGGDGRIRIDATEINGESKPPYYKGL